jgi:hypothetical protein
MSESSRRGTFEERKTKAIARNKERAVEVLETLEKKDAELTTEERQERTRSRIAMIAFMAAAKRSGISMKEIKRNMKRKSKKSV